MSTRNPFGQVNEDEVNAGGGYTEGLAKDITNQVVRAVPTAIDAIWADALQPRDAVPAIVKGGWRGNPAEVPAVLAAFAEAAAGEWKRVDIAAAIKGREAVDVPDENTHPIGYTYAKLVNMAVDIKQVGLTNPITVARVNGRDQIETGERRWLAYHLLKQYDDAQKWAKIPARKVEFDVFRQATENYNREEVKAIGTAAQVCRLIIECLRREKDIVPPEQCGNKRMYFAQVADGNQNRVTEADKKRIQNAVGGMSWAWVSLHRNLAALTGDNVVDDAIWLAGSTLNWAERAMRDIKPAREWGFEFAEDYRKALRHVVSGENWDLKDLHAIKAEYEMSFTMVKLEAQRRLEEEAEKQTPPPAPPRERRGEQDAGDDEDWTGKAVRLDSGVVIWVTADNGEKLVGVREGAIGSVKTYFRRDSVVAVDVDPRDGTSKDERKRQQDFFGAPVHVLLAGEWLPGMGQAVLDGGKRLRVVLKTGEIETVGADDVRLDEEALGRDKQSSMGLSDYYDKSPSTSEPAPTSPPAPLRPQRGEQGAGGAQVSAGKSDNDERRVYALEWKTVQRLSSLSQMARMMELDEQYEELQLLQKLNKGEVEDKRADGTLHAWLNARYKHVCGLLDAIQTEILLDIERLDKGE